MPFVYIFGGGEVTSNVYEEEHTSLIDDGWNFFASTAPPPHSVMDTFGVKHLRSCSGGEALICARGCCLGPIESPTPSSVARLAVYFSNSVCDFDT